MATPLNASVLKGFEILSLFLEGHTQVSVTDVAERTGMNSSTAHRFLLTLERTGALRCIRRGQYVMGPLLEDLSQQAVRANPVLAFVEPEVHRLSRTLNESVMACRQAIDGPACVAVAVGPRPISVNISVGTVLPFHKSAQGKIWLADMPDNQRAQVLDQVSPAISARRRNALEAELTEISRRQFAVNRGDNEPDIAAVSVPLRDSFGRLLLTVSVFGMMSRFDQRLVSAARRELSGLCDRVRTQLADTRTGPA